MIRGVIAEAAFEVELVDKLRGWTKVPFSGNVSYDFHLRDQTGDVRIQVKLQRSKAGRPMRASEAPRYLSFRDDWYLVETQKTRAGKNRKTGVATRPYRFGEFDLLAVAMYPATQRWDTFRYTVANWLLADPSAPSQILKYQPIPRSPNKDWTDSFSTAVKWFRSKGRKKIKAR